MFAPSPSGPFRPPPPLRSIAPACLCLLAVAAFIASPIFAQAQATDTPLAAAQDLRQTALGFRNAQDFDKAIETYKALLAENPPDALSIKVDLGLVYKAKKDYANAMPLFTEVASSQDKRKAESMFYIEDCYCEQGKIADAVAELTKAYNECPDRRGDVLLRRAARQCDIQKYKEALADYQEFLANYPDKKDLTATFSARLPEIKLRATGLFDGPATALETEWANAKNANADPAYIKLVGFRLADRCLAEQAWPKGAKVHALLIQDYPADELQLKMGLGLCQKGQKQYDKATQTFTEIADKDNARAVQALFLIEDCLSEQRKYADCVAHLTNMLADHPEAEAEIRMRRAARLGDARKSAECLADLLEVEKTSPERYNEARLGEGLARLTIGQKTKDAAELAKGIQILQSYPAAFPNEPVFAAASQLHLGMYYVYSGNDQTDPDLRRNPDKGRTILTTAARELPFSMYTWWMKAETAISYSSQFRCSEGISEIDILLGQNPPASWEECLLNCKWFCLMHMKRIDDAEQVVQTLVRKYPTGQWTKVTQAQMDKYCKAEATNGK